MEPDARIDRLGAEATEVLVLASVVGAEGPLGVRLYFADVKGSDLTWAGGGSRDFASAPAR